METTTRDPERYADCGTLVQIAAYADLKLSYRDWMLVAFVQGLGMGGGFGLAVSIAWAVGGALLGWV